MEKLKSDLDSKSAQRRQRAIQRMKVIKPFSDGKNPPEAMILEVIPVIPPELRPMVQLDGGRFATSDLNDLYRRLINRNNVFIITLYKKNPLLSLYFVKFSEDQKLTKICYQTILNIYKNPERVFLNS